MDGISELALALAERYSKALGSTSPTLQNAIDEYKRDRDANCQYVLSLFEERAGLVSRTAGSSPEQRLNNPRLLTVYPAERKRALAVKALKDADTIAALLPQLVAAAIRYELAQKEYQIELDREAAGHEAARTRSASGLYPEVADKANQLFNVFEVNRWHWASLRPAEVRAIAAILRREPITSLPPVDTSLEGEG